MAPALCPQAFISLVFLGFPWFSLVFFGGFWTFQRVTANPNKFFLPRRPPLGDMRCCLGCSRCCGAHVTLDEPIHLRAILLAISVSRKKLSKNFPGPSYFSSSSSARSKRPSFAFSSHLGSQ